MYTLVFGTAVACSVAGMAPAEEPEARSARALEGEWAVVCLERGGRPVPGATDMTVTVKGGKATFATPVPAGGRPAGTGGLVAAMRFDFAPGGRVVLTEAGADGTFGPAPGARQTRDDGRAVAPAPAVRPAGTKSGVYVLTQDYFAVCIHEDGARGEAGPGGAEDRAEDQPGADPRPGPDDRAGGAGRAATAREPLGRGYCTVILRRAANRGGDSPGPGRNE